MLELMSSDGPTAADAWTLSPEPSALGPAVKNNNAEQSGLQHG